MIPRNEYPRPQLVRSDWVNLNGEWEFLIDNEKCGLEKGYASREHLDKTIIVPFCPESELSGIGNKDFMLCVWYRKNFEIPKNQTDKRTILHFGAVDYHSIVFVNGAKVGEHKGGYTSFSFDITDYLKESDNFISLCVTDDVRSFDQPAGKQSDKLCSYGCFYTRTTGIWQTVWLEFVDPCHVVSVLPAAEIDTPSVALTVGLSKSWRCRVTAQVFWEGKPVGGASANAFGDTLTLSVPLSEKHLWEVGQGNLYDVTITLEKEGEICDTISSYFGLRTVAMDGRAFTVNGKVVFGRWVLDQGFYPDGIYTAPTDEAFKNDILYAMQLGFNGARLHEKVFDPRFLYWADKLGYLVWGEHANWGLNITDAGQIRHFLPEWIEAVRRDMAHPSIIGWCPFNETWDFEGRKQCDDVISMVYHVTKAIDPTRPVIDTSGNFHVISDIFDLHDYAQEPEVFSAVLEDMDKGIIKDHLSRNPVWDGRQHYNGKDPVFVSEYGGIAWLCGQPGWGYGNAPQTEQDFIERYRNLTEILMDNPRVMGFCYTQLYDVEQEKNGLLTYEREFKFAPQIFKAINAQSAAIETIK